MSTTISSYFPTKLPPGWEMTEHRMDGMAWMNPKRRLSVISSIESKEGSLWLHVSVARRSKMPSYDDLAYIRKHFISEELRALIVFPTEDKPSNLHKYCLHFWCSLEEEGDGLPEFSGVLPDGRRSI